MKVTLAALDATAAARPVLETALATGRLTSSEVEAIHVRSRRQRPSDTPRSLAERFDVPLTVVEGRVGPALDAAVGARRVAVAVVGARATPGGRRPVGHCARGLIEHSNKPVVVVAPDAHPPPGTSRLLIPLEGADVSSRPILERLVPLLSHEAELVVLHVFTGATVPPMLDRPAYDLDLLGREFAHRHCPLAVEVELRRGSVAEAVNSVGAHHDVDLVVLSWSQRHSPGHARVIRDVLGSSALPVMLLPVSAEPAEPPVELLGQPAPAAGGGASPAGARSSR